MRAPGCIRWLIAGGGLCLGAWACGDSPADASRAPRREDAFVAMARDFRDHRAWEAFSLPEAANASAADIHGQGPRTVYLNRRPPGGSSEFPVGTMVVKVTPSHTFAMAKRGGGYNSEGARGWEWFELEQVGVDILIEWRGLGPPAGEQYGQTDETCNSCHSLARDNDWVMSTPLRLPF